MRRIAPDKSNTSQGKSLAYSKDLETSGASGASGAIDDLSGWAREEYQNALEAGLTHEAALKWAIQFDGVADA